ncbi:HpcH/HpaI aldolase/citrate lyase family protein [Comamonas endophytica]|uniref:CoA ester lyase n=1 Tax=Comamonas endophytica TaxID=2949090 RepID=A0ABY6G735_9BURK|nr:MULTISPECIES: CoA ester lyase [unclassified Acidovorax]MCD2511455.1 CoA ester lyase [Acidovorax sp. D4N7]UYG50846.1 CoA ester lyase [Acidovorax sp. 5MLIR]
MPDRSYLFVPGDRPDRFEKALDTGAHAVILDLEDAVQPERKDAARQKVAEWLAGAGRPVYVRINAFGTPWHMPDRELLKHASVRGVMLPKSEDPGQLQQLASLLQPGQTLLPLIETVEGWFNIQAISQGPCVERLAFGSVDFMADSGIQGDGAELDAVRTLLVLHSRRAGLLAPIDGVSLAINDQERLRADVLRSRKWGFGAKLCIHPGQITAVHEGFAPSEQEIQWARKVLQALEKGQAGAIAVDGKLVDKPVILLAQSILAE